MQKKALLYEVNLSGKLRNGSRAERVLKTTKKHRWSGKSLYALYRHYSIPVVLFVPTRLQMMKIKKRSGVIRIYSSQTESGTGLGL